MTNADLLKFIKQSTSKHIQHLVPEDPLNKPTRSHDFEQQVRTFVQEELGPVITTEKSLKAAAKMSGPRAALIRGICGGMPSASLWRAIPGGQANFALHVWNGSFDYADPSLLVRWTSNAGSSGRKRDARISFSQDVGDATKRFKTKSE